MRKVLKTFEIVSQPDGPVGKPNWLVHWVMFAGTEVWVLSLFVLVLCHSESELHSVCFFGFIIS